MTNKQLSDKLDELMNRLPQTQPAHTPEQIALAQSLGITLPKPVDTVKEKLETIDKKQNAIIAFLACLLLLMALPLLSIDGCKQNPTPTPPNPVSSEILIDTKAEYEIVMGALNFVEDEWALSRYDSVAEAKQGLSSLLGGSTGGVKSRSLILAGFKDDCDFPAVVEDVKKKSV